MKKTLSILAIVFLTVSCVKNSTSSSTKSTNNTDSFSQVEKVYTGFVTCDFLESTDSIQNSTTPRLKVSCATESDSWNNTEGYVGNLLSSSSSHWTRDLNYYIRITHNLGGDSRFAGTNVKLGNLSLLEIVQALDIRNRSLSSTKPILDQIQAALQIKEAQSDLAKRYELYWRDFQYQVYSFTKEAPVSLAKYREGDELLSKIGDYDERLVSSFDPTSAVNTTPDEPKDDFIATYLPDDTAINTSNNSTAEDTSNNTDTGNCFCKEHLGVYMIWNESTQRMGAWRYTKTNNTNLVEICESLLKGGSNIKTNKILEAYHKDVLKQVVVCNDYLPY